MLWSDYFSKSSSCFVLKHIVRNLRRKVAWYIVLLFIFSGVQMNALRAPKALNVCRENEKSVKKGHSVMEKVQFWIFYECWKLENLPTTLISFFSYLKKLLILLPCCNILVTSWKQNVIWYYIRRYPGECYPSKKIVLK